MRVAWSHSQPVIRLRALPPWQRRMTLAVLASIALHAAAIYGVRAGWVDAAPGGSSLLIAHLVALPPADDDPETKPADEPIRSITDRPSPLPTTQADSAITDVGSDALPLALKPTKSYYLASHLTRAPAPLEGIRFDYPAESTVREAVVVARVLINERGGVDNVLIDKADPPGMFEANTVASLMRTRFSPGELRQKQVASQISMEVHYQNPDGTPGGMSVTAVGP